MQKVRATQAEVDVALEALQVAAGAMDAAANLAAYLGDGSAAAGAREKADEYRQTAGLLLGAERVTLRY